MRQRRQGCLLRQGLTRKGCAVLTLLSLILLYFLPTIIGRDKRDAAGIILLNLFLGWTVIGWVIALVWACTSEPYSPVRMVPVAGWRTVLLPMRNVRVSRTRTSALPVAAPFDTLRSSHGSSADCKSSGPLGEMTESNTQDLREEFNRWAEAGRGEGMEQDHLPITLPVLEQMRLEPTDNVLDVGCGSGWLSRRIAANGAGRASGGNGCVRPDDPRGAAHQRRIMTMCCT